MVEPSPRAVLLCLALAASGCAAVGPDYVVPTAPAPGDWSETLPEGMRTGTPRFNHWWDSFDDPVLSELVERVVQGNLDLRGAVSRIDEARARAGIARGDWFPAVDASAAYERNRQSEQLGIGGTTIGDLPGVSVSDRDTYTVGLGASWEVDVFGRVRRSVEASQATLEASVEDHRGVLVALQAEVALAYVDVRSTQMRIAIAEENVATQQRSEELVRARFDAGMAHGLELAQAEANVAGTRSTLPQLRSFLQRTVNRLSVLMGEAPGSLGAELGDVSPLFTAPEAIALGIPADLLRQRPDIRRAERLLAAQTARVGVATADLYPRLSLTGVFGFNAMDVTDLFQSSTRTFGVGPSVVWRIFDMGRVRGAIEVEDARVEQALVAYEQTVLEALEEVEAALIDYRHEGVRNASLRTAVDASRRAASFAEDLYKSGKTDFQNVLDAQRNQLAFEDQLASSDAALVTHIISLYRAMGGGWQTERSDPE